MPSCAVKGCNNTSAKKFKMCSFPRNPVQRAAWIKNMAQKDWLPNENAALCEVHFDSSMWEKTRVDGTRKLKFNAVPTIFGDRKIIHPIKTEADSNRKSLDDASVKNIILSNNQTLLKIIPQSDSSKTQSTPILVPVSNLPGAQSIKPVIINGEGKVVDSSLSSKTLGATSILKPIIKSDIITPLMTISTNSSILKSQTLLKAANSKTPIVIPAMKSQLQTFNPQLSSFNLSDVSQEKIVISQPILLPTSTNIPKIDLHVNSQDQSTVTTNDIVIPGSPDTSNSELSAVSNYTNKTKSNSSVEQQATSLKSTGIILNKIEAKKAEDERFEKMDKLLLKQLRLNNALRKKLNMMKNKIHRLMKEQNNDQKGFLRDVFTEDQIRALELKYTNPRSITAWSHRTMMKALKLKQECGTRGYEELLNQNMPFPSIRTISRWCSARNIPIP